MKTNADKIKKITKIKLYKLKLRYKKVLMTVLAASTAVAMDGSKVVPKGYGHNKDGTNKNITVDKKVQIDIDKEIEKRVEWIICEYLDANNRLLDKLMSYRGNPKAKHKYIKSHIFDHVSPRAGLEGTDDYCIAGINRAWRDVKPSALKDAENFLPPTDIKNKDSEAAVRCLEFIGYLEKIGYKDYITRVRHNRVNFEQFNPGDIIFEPRDNKRGLKHAVTCTYKLSPNSINSYNIDKRREARVINGEYIRIDMTGIVKEAVCIQLEKENLIQKTEDGYKNIMSEKDAKELIAYFYQDREGGEMTLFNYINKPKTTFFASTKLFETNNKSR